MDIYCHLWDPLRDAKATTVKTSGPLMDFENPRCQMLPHLYLDRKESLCLSPTKTSRGGWPLPRVSSHVEGSKILPECKHFLDLKAKFTQNFLQNHSYDEVT